MLFGKITHPNPSREGNYIKNYQRLINIKKMYMKKSVRKIILGALLVGALIVPAISFASEHGGESSGGHGDVALVFGAMAIILILSKVGSLITRFGQPAVLGEILVGVVLGNLALLGFGFFRELEHNAIIAFLAEFGVVLLLFQIGLESNVKEIKSVGAKSLVVAMIGVVAPFVLGTYLIGPYIFPGLEQIAYLFIGASLTATSVGITGRVFKDFNKLHIKEAKVVLGAAVIDDVMGLLILAVITAIATVGSISPMAIAIITVKAFGFLFGGIIIGKYIATTLGKVLLKIHTGIGMKLSLALSIGLFFSYIASLFGLAPIIGAFVAGLLLDNVCFSGFKNYRLIRDIEKWLKKENKDKNVDRSLYNIMSKHSHKHVEDLIENVAFVFVPIFFVYTGLQVKLETFFNPKVLLIALLVTAVAIVGKVISSVFLPKKYNKWIVGFAMVPRGEVGLIFGNIGKSLGVISDELFSVIIVMVILTTLVAPPVLSCLLKKHEDRE